MSVRRRKQPRQPQLISLGDEPPATAFADAAARLVQAAQLFPGMRVCKRVEQNADTMRLVFEMDSGDPIWIDVVREPSELLGRFRLTCHSNWASNSRGLAATVTFHSLLTLVTPVLGALEREAIRIGDIEI